MSESMSGRIQRSPFKNVYWFARHLMNTDQYGSLGRSKEAQLLKAVELLDGMMAEACSDDEEGCGSLKLALMNALRAMAGKGSKLPAQAGALAAVLDREIQTAKDIAVFCIAVKYVVVPINHALSAIPSNDVEFCMEAAGDILDRMGEEGAGIVISAWDTMGVKGCLDAERAVVAEEFARLVSSLPKLNIEHDETDDNLILTAFMQEFERRLGQKRKARGGNSLEAAADFLFNYYNFKSTTAPSHFDQDIEVDKWFKCRDGWTIGISCKRTLRERWKQLSQADRGTLSHFKIKELWHLITYDKDLSDDKIVRLGEQGQIFYLMDTSGVYKRCAAHPGMMSYVRPLSGLIADIRVNMRG